MSDLVFYLYWFLIMSLTPIAMVLVAYLEERSRVYEATGEDHSGTI